jgi:hypothetical protein
MLPRWRVSDAASCQDYVVSTVDEWNVSMKHCWSDTDRRNWYTMRKMCPTTTLFFFFFFPMFFSFILFILLCPPLLNSFSILFICHSYHHSLPLAVFISLILSQFREILLKTCCYRTRVCSVLHCCIDFPQVTFALSAHTCRFNLDHSWFVYLAKEHNRKGHLTRPIQWKSFIAEEHFCCEEMLPFNIDMTYICICIHT